MTSNDSTYAAPQDSDQKRSQKKSVWEVLWVSLKLGLTSFGGPTAHLGYFHHEYVQRRKWLNEKAYADLVALCQFLPGPASSQVGIGIGLTRAGLLGGVAAWLGFTLPSVVILIAFAMLVGGGSVESYGWLKGLKIVAVVIVAQAILGMGKTLAPDRIRMSIVGIAAAIALVWASPISQIVIIMAAAVVGWFLYRQQQVKETTAFAVPIGRTIAVNSLILFGVLLVLLPLMRMWTGSDWVAMIDSFYRSGSLVFGGGHVVLPLLERELIPMGWLSENEFLAGYGAAQAVPGPLFTFAAYLGAISNGIFGAVVATLSIFLPAFLLVVGVLPFWNHIRRLPYVQAMLMGVNAAVVGILLGALYDPIWVQAINGTMEFVLAVFLFILLVCWKLPPWMIVAGGALGGWVLL
ncbi:chromate transporter [Paenibacillus aquistagni]|uniref:chromate transporter n=1 Tax=Paenibacillus aquistagni TaxID=1852522 RepID=UPI00145B4160|nr:chromate transporter [Paenibacillus aquistagni]NMM50942.1 chromate transporter [Paenibacillus aquistagni]